MRLFIASMGRSGSSLLYRSAVKAAPEHFHRGFFRSIKKAPKEDGIYKTHDYPPPHSDANDLFIYLFRHPEQVVTSVSNTNFRFKVEHFKNLQKRYVDDHTSLLTSDGMGLSEHFLSWRKFKASSPVLYIRYDEIWKHEKLLRDFTELELCLPRRNPARVHPEIPLEVDFSDLSKRMNVGLFFRNYSPSPEVIHSE